MHKLQSCFEHSFAFCQTNGLCHLFCIVHWNSRNSALQPKMFKSHSVTLYANGPNRDKFPSDAFSGLGAGLNALQITAYAEGMAQWYWQQTYPVVTPASLKLVWANKVTAHTHAASFWFILGLLLLSSPYHPWNLLLGTEWSQLLAICAKSTLLCVLEFLASERSKAEAGRNSADFSWCNKFHCAIRYIKENRWK